MPDRVVVGIGVVALPSPAPESLRHARIGVTRTPRQAEGFDDICRCATECRRGARRFSDQRSCATRRMRAFSVANFSPYEAFRFTSMPAADRRPTNCPGRSVAGRRIAGAGLDVFRPTAAAGSPLWELPNVFITPHLGGYTSDYGFDHAADHGKPAALSPGRTARLQNIVKR